MTRRLQRSVLTLQALLLCGCARAPAFSIMGSYFPAWMLCAIAGIVLAVLLRLVVVRLKLEEYAWPTVLTYPCAAAFFTFLLWLLLF